MRKSTVIPTALVAAGLLTCVGNAHALAGETAQGYAAVSLSSNDSSQYSYGQPYTYADQKASQHPLSLNRGTAR